jgi:hypothetical protein
MSKKNNINPDHYKTAGRERPGEDIIHEVYKRRYAISKSQAGVRERTFIPGVREKERIVKAETEMIAENERRIDEAYHKGG